MQQQRHGVAGATGRDRSVESPGGKSSAGTLAAASAQPTRLHPHDSGLLGAGIGQILPGSRETQLALLIVLSAAIFLLALGALPRQVVPHPAAAAFVARRRGLIAAAGLMALAAFLVSYLLP